MPPLMLILNAAMCANHRDLNCQGLNRKLTAYVKKILQDYVKN